MEKDKEGFRRFVNYLIERGPDGAIDGNYGVRVRHWTRYYDICHFCAINYNFVGKIEDINEDAPYVLQVKLKADFISNFSPKFESN